MSVFRSRRPRIGGEGFERGDQAPPNVVYRWEFLCLDANSGKELWKKTVLERKPTIPTHRTNTYASETPVTDGERIYAYFRQRLPDARGFTASPWADDGKIYYLDEEGQTFVLAAGPAYKLLGKSSLGEMCWATPALSKKAVVLRTLDHLYSLKQ